jgi:hypothetical protein
MPIRATQPISSAFGTYMPGDEITEVAAGPVLNAWLAAGIAIEEETAADRSDAIERDLYGTDDDEEATVAEQPKPAAPIERTTMPQRETAVGRRQAETPHRRFQTDADAAKAPHRRFVQDTGGTN